jgi:hypothetical protein
MWRRSARACTHGRAARQGARTSTASLNALAWSKAAWPMLPSMTKMTSEGFTFAATCRQPARTPAPRHTRVLPAGGATGRDGRKPRQCSALVRPAQDSPCPHRPSRLLSLTRIAGALAAASRRPVAARAAPTSPRFPPTPTAPHCTGALKPAVRLDHGGRRAACACPRPQRARPPHPGHDRMHLPGVRV